MKTTHTPGPWMVINHTDCLYVTSKVYGAICQIPFTKLTFDEHVANSKIIAVVPELLATLEELLPKLSQLQDETAFTWPEKVEKLIAKAKGL